MAGGRDELVERVLEHQARLLFWLRLPQADDLLTVDLTMQQFKTVVLLGVLGAATAGQLARRLGVGLSTMTGIVDRLCERGMVTRGEDPEDRRATRVELTGAGVDLVQRVNSVRREVWTALLDRLSLERLECAAELMEALADAATALTRDASEDDAVALR